MEKLNQLVIDCNQPEHKSIHRDCEKYELENYQKMLSEEIMRDVKTDNSKLLFKVLLSYPVNTYSDENESLILEEVFKELTDNDAKEAALEFMECREELKLRDRQYQAYLDDPYQLARG